MATLRSFASTGSPGVIVPKRRRLTVETLSLQVDVAPSGTKLETFVRYTGGGQSITLFVPVTYAYTDPGTGFDFYVALQAVRLYPDPGTFMEVSVHSPAGSGGTLFLTVSGQLT
jgi:hypothetical protein